ncbi:SDR family NAD(P)-dependent oxidoreductase [Roseiarcaceae bacterium H3SJ34-1]|uniref:SDR family NAD(P)-dependent oxidoreductase n=1 Tax=Terripilifer ovatus TaxID=3032367 RepID=UPI003AB9575F|nr:SDR family NAD(P)-dependent oxidoreductase [Roseiarcaceae bacterium H3SJ34-1]
MSNHPAPAHIAITGAGGGIGAALALAYAKPGARLSLSGRNLDRLEQTAGLCRQRGAQVDVGQCDVTDAQAMQGWIDRIEVEQQVDILIANAGIGGEGTLTRDAAEAGEVARAVVTTNTIGVINTVTPILPHFVARKSGVVVIVSSVAGFLGLPDSPSYSASKAAASVYGDSLRRLLRPQGIQVTVVSPGYVETPMSATLPFHRPFMWSAEKAANVIQNAVANGHGELIFPWQFRLAISVARVLPTAFVDFLLMRFRARDVL